MSDKELLELAAKAAGIVGEVEEFYFRLGDKLPRLAIGVDSESGAWDPIHSDGDALRLAVKLNLTIFCSDEYCCCESEGPGVSVAVLDGGKAAATRLAIVRAAAEIGKAMP